MDQFRTRRPGALAGVGEQELAALAQRLGATPPIPYAAAPREISGETADQRSDAMRDWARRTLREAFADEIDAARTAGAAPMAAASLVLVGAEIARLFALSPLEPAAIALSLAEEAAADAPLALALIAAAGALADAAEGPRALAALRPAAATAAEAIAVAALRGAAARGDAAELARLLDPAPIDLTEFISGPFADAEPLLWPLERRLAAAEPYQTGGAPRFGE